MHVRHTHARTLAHLQSLPLNDEVALWHAIILPSTRHSAGPMGIEGGERGERGRRRAAALYVIGTCEKYQRGQHELAGRRLSCSPVLPDVLLEA